jgi:hypothetical protein
MESADTCELSAIRETQRSVLPGAAGPEIISKVQGTNAVDLHMQNQEKMGPLSRF